MPRSRFPPPSPIYSVRATYIADPESFFSAARQAAARLTHSTGKHWSLDGWKSDRLYLRLSFGEHDKPFSVLPYLDVEFDLLLNSSTVTVGILTTSTDLRNLFDHFTRHLDNLLPRSTP